MNLNSQNRVFGVGASALAAAIAVAPTWNLPLQGDEKYAIYVEATAFRGNPLRAFSLSIREVPQFLDKGNFRPLGRLLGEHLPHYLDWTVAELLGVRVERVVTVMSGLAAFALIATILTAIEYLWPPLAKNRVGILAIVTFVAASLASVGLTAPLIVFPAVYLLSTAVTIGLSAWALGPIEAPSALHPPGRRAVTILGLLVAGAASAAFNELVTVGVWSTLVVAVARHLSTRQSIRVSAQRLLPFLGGNVVVLIAARLAMSSRTADQLYDGSEMHLSASAVRLLAMRWTSGTPGANARYACTEMGEVSCGAARVGVAGVVIVLLASAVLWYLRTRGSAGDETSAAQAQAGHRWSLVDPLLMLGAIGISAAAVVSLSVQMQSGRRVWFGPAWRDGAATAPTFAAAVALVAVGAAGWPVRSVTGGRWLVWATLGVGLVLMCSGAAQTLHVVDELRSTPDSIQVSRVSGFMTKEGFAASSEDERCAVLWALRRSRDWHSWNAPTSYNPLAQWARGRPFCAQFPATDPAPVPPS